MGFAATEGIVGVLIWQEGAMEHRRFLQRLDEVAELTHAQADAEQRGDGDEVQAFWTSASRRIPNARTAVRAALKAGAGRGTACRAAAASIANAPSTC